ncbi:LacI family transcriptional regulator [Scardovia inopinata]|uniref:Uncharacterized protein n=1 Tax=Scardovia inopinata F0304 TaxID=641146 RepID=W5IGT3_SCAIO|nr:LacI family DNA-binding transcriptional regulator [Scardovia inopinata]EFG26046.1 hypothetical protein HMPREF9020_01118 [Scardovia inopinata F0304]BAR07321.1 transcriptional regulator [Scardovia inopinata JCM 12537]SUV51398.1 LacI family transcriptional regulator [Scardovia inopinata]
MSRLHHIHPVSLIDVAQAAGVSTQTVSRVANGSPAVKENTRVKVQHVMDALGYHPNSAARMLKRGSFRTIGVILFNFDSVGNINLLKGISAAAKKSGYAITLLIADDKNDKSLELAINHIQNLAIDGVIVVAGTHLQNINSYVPPQNLPLVLITEGPVTYCHTIDNDQYGCAAEATEYLLSLGHKTVYHVCGPINSITADGRERGWRETLLKHKIQPPQVLVGDWTADSGYANGCALASYPTCTAVFAANDQTANGIIAGLESCNKKVPKDVSVVGVDDSLKGIIPHLDITTMRIDFDELGRQSFTLILDILAGNGPDVNTKIVLPAKLIKRKTADRPQTA